MTESAPLSATGGAASAAWPRNFVSDFDVTELLVSERRSLAMAPSSDSIRRGGAGLIGLVATMVDVAASSPAMIASRPGWITTQDLSVQRTGTPVTGPLVVDCTLARAGSKVVTVTAIAYDGAGVTDIRDARYAVDRGDGLLPVARSLITFARITRAAAPGMEDYDPSAWIGQDRRMASTPPPDETIEQRMGVREVDGTSGRLELALRPYLTNSIGTIVGGAQFVLAALAAERAQPGWRASDLQMHFLAQLKVGPSQTRTALVRSGQEHRVVAVEIIDAGDPGRTLSLASVTLTAEL